MSPVPAPCPSSGGGGGNDNSVGLLADRPISGTNVGDIYTATDDHLGTSYIWDGSTWIEMANPVAGIITKPQQPIGGDYSVSLDERVILVQLIASPITVTLPAGADDSTLFIIKDFNGLAGTYPITIDTAGVDTIDGSASYVMNVNYMSLLIAHTGGGTTYFVI